MSNQKTALKKIYQQYGKPCWEPIISKVSQSNDVIKSKYFGNPWLAIDEKWPEILGEPAQFVLQLDISTLPKPMSEALGGKGLLQFFYPAEGVWGDEDDYILRVVHPDGVGAQLPQPIIEDMNPEYAHQKVIESWVEHIDLPHGEEDIEGYEEASEEYCENYDEELEYAYQGDKLGGWEFWTQASLSDESSILFYQLDAGCFFDGLHFPAHAPDLFAGDGTAHIIVSRDNPNDLTFCWACT